MKWVTDLLIFNGMPKKFRPSFFRIARAALRYVNEEHAQTGAI